MLDSVVKSVEAFNRSVEREAGRARTDAHLGQPQLAKRRAARAPVAETSTPTGLSLPRLALPQIDEPGEIVRHLMGEGLPGEFRLRSAAYPQMYLAHPEANGHEGNGHAGTGH